MNNLPKFNKKILILSSWAPPMIGGPQNLYNIFSNINPDFYFILTSFINNKKNQQNSVSGTPLKGKYCFYDEDVYLEQGAKNQESGSVRTKNIINLRKSLIFIIKKFPLIGKYLGDFMGVCFAVLRFIKKALQIIKDERINLLIGISDEGVALLSTFLIHQISKKPYALYFFDIYKGNFLKWPFGIIAKILEKSLIKNATLVIVTNEGTEKYYKKLYGDEINTTVIHNSVFAESYKKTQTTYQPRPPYQIVFTGNLYWPQERSVRNLITAVSGMKDINIRLLLYVPKPPQDLIDAYKNDPKIKFDVAPQSEMPQIQSEADILFLPFAWNTPSPQIIATASPGKLTDYLASGRPILIHAPPYAYVCKYARQHNFAHIIDEENIALLQDGIKKLVLDPEYSRKLISNAQKIFHQNHDAIKNAELLKKIINEL